MFLTQTTNFTLVQIETVCRRKNFKFDEKIRKFSKRVENTVGKGEIARYEQFLLFPQCFQKACFPGASRGVIVWEWVKVVKRALCLPACLCYSLKRSFKTVYHCNHIKLTVYSFT